MKEQIRILFTAVMFYTRIPCPSWVDHSEQYINKSIRYFPVIGWIIGGISAVFCIAATFFFSPMLGAILFLVSSIWLTGAFHEDGFADVCDGFGGGWTKMQVLTIMKDSRVGTYAVVGLLLLLMAKVALVMLLQEQIHDFALLGLVLINAHTLSRLLAATVVFTHSYVREDELSKAKPIAKSSSIANVGISIVMGIVPFVVLLFYTQQVVLVLLPFFMYLVKMWLARKFKKKIGGYTGDCLGATQQVTELSFYLFTALVWKYTF